MAFTLNDTPFSDETVIQEHINAGITLVDAVNFLVEKYELVRIDRQRGLNPSETVTLSGRSGYFAGAAGNRPVTAKTSSFDTLNLGEPSSRFTSSPIFFLINFIA